MARYQTDRFEEAAKAYFEAYGEVPTRKEAAEQSGKVREMAGRLAKKLGEKHPAYAGLHSVSTLRLSIARRFITISVAALAPAPRKTSEPAAAKGSAKATNGKARAPRRQAAPAAEAPANQPTA
jgi:hypothetical protein